MNTKMPRHYSYRVDHDLGFAPHVWRNIATVVGCKTTTIELWAVKGSWVIGIGGKGTGQSDKLVYAMKVTETPTYAEFRLGHPAAAAYLTKYDFPDDVQVLKSQGEFYYFGNHALTIPAGLGHIIHPTQGCKRVSDQDIEMLRKGVFVISKRGSMVIQTMHLLLFAGSLGPNRSLNRTLHSMPAFGLAFHASPNAVLLFRAG